MGAYIRRLSLDEKNFYIGFSTVTDTYFTKPYKDINQLVAETLDRNGKNVFYGPVKPEEVEETVYFNTKDIEDLKKVIVQLEGGNISLTNNEKQLIGNIVSFISNILDYYSEGYPQELEKTINASSTILGFGSDYGTPDDALSVALDSVLSAKDPERKEAILVGRFLHKLLDTQGFYKTPPATIISLLDNMKVS